MSMHLGIPWRVLVAFLLSAVTALSLAGCGFTPDSNESPDSNDYSAAGSTGPVGLAIFNSRLVDAGGELPSETVAVTVELKVRTSDPCLGAVVDGVERYPIWPEGTKTYLSVAENAFKVTFPDGTVLKPSLEKPLMLTAPAYVDHDGTFFGGDPEKQAYVVNQEGSSKFHAWYPVNYAIGVCGLEGQGVVVFPEATSIKVEPSHES